MELSWLHGVVSLLCLAGCGPALAQSESTLTRAGGPLRVVVANRCFGGGEENGARVGARLLERHLEVETSRAVELILVTADEEMKSWMADGGADVVLATGEVWATGGGEQSGMVPILQSHSPRSGEGVWVVLGRSPGEGSGVSQGHVVVGGGGEGELPSIWFDTWRRAQGWAAIPALPTRRMTREPKADLAVLRTYFGKADACVVPEAVFAAAVASNPEVGMRLKKLAQSPPFPGAVLAVRADLEAARASAVRRAAERLAHTPRGSALAVELGTRRFVPFAFDRWSAVADVAANGGPQPAGHPAAVADGSPPHSTRRSTTP